jgi:hypothetical protein
MGTLFTDGWKKYPELRKLNFAVITSNLTVNGTNSNIIKKRAISNPIMGTDATLTGPEQTDLTNIGDQINEIETEIKNYVTTSNLSPSNTEYTIYSDIVYTNTSSNFPWTNLVLTFDAQQNPNAIFVLQVKIHSSFNEFILVNGAKKENIFILNTNTDTTYTNCSFFGNLFFEVGSSFTNCTLHGGLFVNSHNVSITDFTITTEPSTSLLDYSYLKDLNILFNSISLQSAGSPLEFSTNTYSVSQPVTTGTDCTFIGVEALEQFEVYTADQESLEDYLINEIYNVCTGTEIIDNTTPLTILPTNTGLYYYSPSKSVPTLTFDGQGNENATFLIYFETNPSFSSHLMSFTNGAKSYNVFFYSTLFFYPGSHVEYEINIVCPKIQTATNFYNTNNMFRFYARGIDWNITSNNKGSILSDVPCFRKGTFIDTPFGKKKIECLNINDSVYTTGEIVNNKIFQYEQHMAQPIRFVGKKTIIVSENSAPVKIPKDLFGKGVPLEDLYVSKNHGIIFDDKLLPAHEMMAMFGLSQCFDEKIVEYYHIELDKHSTIIANGSLCESFLNCDNKVALEEKKRIPICKKNQLNLCN